METYNQMKKAKIISITHQKGGVGKSTLAANIAFNIAKTASVAIVDLDHQSSLISLKNQFENIKIFPATINIQEIKYLEFDFVIVDTPPYLFNHLRELANMSDVVIIPTKASLLDAIAISQSLNILLQEIEIEKLLIVMNMVKANTTLTNDVYREIKKYGVEIAKTRISDLVDFTRSIMNKGLVTRKAQAQINAITKEILIKLL